MYYHKHFIHKKWIHNQMRKEHEKGEGMKRAFFMPFTDKSGEKLVRLVLIDEKSKASDYLFSVKNLLDVETREITEQTLETEKKLFTPIEEIGAKARIIP